MNNEIVVDGVTYVKKEVEVKYWEGLKGIEGYYIANHSDIHSAENAETHKAIETSGLLKNKLRRV